MNNINNTKQFLEKINDNLEEENDYVNIEEENDYVNIGEENDYVNIGEENDYVNIGEENIKTKSNLILKTTNEYQEPFEDKELKEYKIIVNKHFNYYDIIYEKLQKDITKTKIKINNIENKLVNKDNFNNKLKTLSLKFNLFNKRNNKNYKYLIKSIEHNQMGIRLLIVYIIIGMIIIITCNY